jgi:hypothetical protein
MDIGLYDPLRESKASTSMLGIEPVADALAAAREMKTPSARGPSMALAAKQDVQEQAAFVSSDMDYAIGVEIENGR